MINFKKPWFSCSNRVLSVSGDPVCISYVPYYDDKGVLQLKESGKKNLYDEIQSHKLSCDIHYILKRFANGEVDALSKAQGLYGDFSDLPKSFAEIMNITIDAENKFNQLPVEIKQKFDNNFVQYMTMFGSAEWADMVGLVSKPASIDNDVEVSSDES